MRIAYLASIYPKTSHTFIRREIAAVERAGIDVVRYSIRRVDEPLVEEADRSEAGRTAVALESGPWSLIAATAGKAVTRPVRFLRAVWTAMRLGRRSERGLLRHLAYLAEACLLAGWMRRDGVEHVHVHFGLNAATVALLIGQLGGPPFSMTVHGPQEFDTPVTEGLGEKVRRSAFTAAVSSYGRAQLMRWAGSSAADKIVEVRCGLEREALHGQVTAVPNVPRLVCVGRLSEQKGIGVLLDAARILKDEGVGCELVLVGDGEMRNEVEAMIARGGLSGCVRISGWMDGTGVRREIESSRALVMASFAEGLPVVLMEAMAAGRPVVATWVAGIPELVVDGVTGWLVPPGDARALADAMRRVLELPAARLSEMGRAGAERVGQRHDVDVEAAKLVRLWTRAREG